MFSKPGNPLGAVRAESDSAMLEKAFLETSEYRSLTRTRDFHFIVGRRGTGKSALCAKVAEYFRGASKTIVLCSAPEEHSAIAFYEMLKSNIAMDYKKLRQISRLIWKINILLTVAIHISKSDRFHSERHLSNIVDYISEHRELTRNLSCANLLRHAINRNTENENLLEIIPRLFSLRELEQNIREFFSNSKFQCVMMYDSLDEGWSPDLTSTAIIGGLAIAIADLTDAKAGIHAMIFVRDNMFRLLASTDEDSSRHIEGATLRLHWDVQSLFMLVCKRIRVVHELDIESDVKVWNRFANREVSGMEGFRKCLLNTLYRPRDVLVLLNSAYQIASKKDRGCIIEEDVEAAARLASHHRLEDLHKEYNGIFPGISKITSIFSGGDAVFEFSEAVSVIDSYTEKLTYEDEKDRDVAILGTAREVLFALYSIGFIGKYDSSNRMYTFCHDGTRSEMQSMINNDRIMIHPCYWIALDLKLADGGGNENIINQINDEYEQKANKVELESVTNVRAKRIGTIIGELSQIEHGNSGEAEFARWMLAAVQILCSGNLSMPRQICTNESRHVVLANITATAGTWKKIGTRFSARHTLFTVVNFPNFKQEDLVAASVGIEGLDDSLLFRVMVLRSDHEILSENEGNLLRTYYSCFKWPILPIPSITITRAIRKLRNPEREDYIESYIKKRLEYIYKNFYSDRKWSL